LEITVKDLIRQGKDPKDIFIWLYELGYLLVTKHCSQRIEVWRQWYLNAKADTIVICFLFITQKGRSCNCPVKWTVNFMQRYEEKIPHFLHWARCNKAIDRIAWAKHIAWFVVSNKPQPLILHGDWWVEIARFSWWNESSRAKNQVECVHNGWPQPSSSLGGRFFLHLLGEGILWCVIIPLYSGSPPWRDQRIEPAVVNQRVDLQIFILVRLGMAKLVTQHNPSIPIKCREWISRKVQQLGRCRRARIVTSWWAIGKRREIFAHATQLVVRQRWGTDRERFGEVSPITSCLRFPWRKTNTISFGQIFLVAQNLAYTKYMHH